MHVKQGQGPGDSLCLTAINEKVLAIDELYKRSHLPDEPDAMAAERVFIAIREELYGVI